MRTVPLLFAATIALGACALPHHAAGTALVHGRIVDAAGSGGEAGATVRFDAFDRTVIAKVDGSFETRVPGGVTTITIEKDRRQTVTLPPIAVRSGRSLELSIALATLDTGAYLRWPGLDYLFGTGWTYMPVVTLANAVSVADWYQLAELDIRRITLRRGREAITLYGTRAVNGVIRIETRGSPREDSIALSLGRTQRDRLAFEQRTVRLNGAVVDAKTGLPVAGAILETYGLRSDDRRLPIPSDGRFAFEARAIDRGQPIIVDLSAPGYASEIRVLATRGCGRDTTIALAFALVREDATVNRELAAPGRASVALRASLDTARRGEDNWGFSERGGPRRTSSGCR